MVNTNADLKSNPLVRTGGNLLLYLFRVCPVSWVLGPKGRHSFSVTKAPPPGGVLPYMALTGTCGQIGYGFQGFLS